MQAPNITLIQNVGGTIQIDFTAANVDSPSSFTLQSTGTVSGAFVDVGSTITNLALVLSGRLCLPLGPANFIDCGVERAGARHQ